MTSTETRYDVHSANHADFDPADYKFIGAIDTETGPFRADDSKGRKAIEAMEAEGFPYVLVHPHNRCDSCGQYLRYVAVMFHHPSAALVEVGIDCLHGRFAMAKSEVKDMMDSAKRAREAHAKLDGYLAACQDVPALAYASYMQNIEVAAPEDTFSEYQSHMLHKITRQSRYYGSLAEWHVDTVEKLVGELEGTLARREAQLAKQAARKAAAGPAPEGRVAVEGVVIKAVEEIGDWGMRTVITVKLDNGALVNGTAAKAIAEDVKLDARVAFTATFKPKATDETFAWFSRPMKAAILAA